MTKLINKLIKLLDKVNLIDEDEITDGYHTRKELYEYRKIYNALLFNEWAKSGEVEVYKSKRHYTGEECFGGRFFLVVAITPFGQISNHYKLEDWDFFQITEYDVSKYPYDGHTPEECLVRMKKMLNKQDKILEL